MKHNQPGYILLLVFSILSLCMSLVGIFFARAASYQQIIQLLTEKNSAERLAYSCTELGQAIFYIPEKDDSKNSQQDDSTKNYSVYQKQLIKILPFINTNTTYRLSESIDGINATIQIYLSSESGKINLNSLYDFRVKKFFNEGSTDNDRKKLCEWLFEQISKITKKPSLFATFEQYLQKRTTEFNDVTELLAISDFAETFKDSVFFTPQKALSEHIFLTDIFTITTNTEFINPWFLSHSWQLILGLTSKKLSLEEQKKLVDSFKNKANWEADWNTSLQLIYQKEYKDLPKEIKSQLTTECEANIFSLLLSATIGETTATNFIILKKQATENLLPFDIIKMYQI